MTFNKIHVSLGFIALALIPNQSLFEENKRRSSPVFPNGLVLVFPPPSVPVVSPVELCPERALGRVAVTSLFPQPAFSVTAAVEVTSLPAAACRQRRGAMSTSLGSNTYNRQNWEDAVSRGGREGPGQPGREGLGWRGPALPRERVGRQGREAKGVRGGGPGAGTVPGDPLPCLVTRCLPWGPGPVLGIRPLP